MGQQRKKAKRSKETLAKRIGKVELALEKIDSQIREIRATGPNPDSMITLDEGCVVNLEELEKKMEEKYNLLAAREEELQNLQKRISVELENLIKKQPAGGNKATRLVSFLVDIGKKH